MPSNEQPAPRTIRSDDAHRIAIGSRLRVLRKRLNLSLREAGERAGLSHSFIRLVERGETEIAVSRLIRLAETYNVLVADVLTDATTMTGVEFNPASEAMTVPSHADGVELTYLSTPSWSLQPFRLTIEPGSALDSHHDDIHHGGDEFLHCVSGQITVAVDQNAYEMAPGDTLVIPEYAAHSYANTGTEPAVLLGAVSRDVTTGR